MGPWIYIIRGIFYHQLMILDLRRNELPRDGSILIVVYKTLLETRILSHSIKRLILLLPQREDLKG